MTMMMSRLILRSLMVVAALAVAGTSGVAQEAKQQPKPPPGARPPTPAPIDRNGVLILIRSTLFALDHANKTGNYTVLRDLGSPGFQSNNAARLAEIFAAERKDNIDLSFLAASTTCRILGTPLSSLTSGLILADLPFGLASVGQAL